MKNQEVSWLIIKILKYKKYKCRNFLNVNRGGMEGKRGGMRERELCEIKPGLY